MMVLRPFDSTTKQVFLILALGQAAFFVLLWLVFPNKLIPGPLDIAYSWHTLASTQGMLIELWNSSITIVKSIILSSLISFGLAYLATAAFFRPMVTWATGLRFLGFAGITFLFTLWASTGSELKLWLLTFGQTVFLLTNAVSMVNHTSQEEIDYARTLRLRGWHITWEMVVRGKLDNAIDMIRQNAAIGWVMLSMVEGLVRSEGGIGALLLSNSKYMNLSSVFAIQLTILAYGILQDLFLRWLRVIICPYVVSDSVKQ